MSIDDIMSELNEKDKIEFKAKLSRVEFFRKQEGLYNFLQDKYKFFILFLRKNKVKSYVIIYVITYLFLLFFANNPFMKFFESAFTYIFLAFPFSLATIIFIFISMAILKLVVFILGSFKNKWEKENKKFDDYVEKKKEELSYGSAGGDYFDPEN